MPRAKIRPGWLLLGLSVLVVTVIILVVGLPIFQTKTAENAIVRIGGKLWHEPRNPQWLRRLFSDDEIAGIDKVLAVDLSGCTINDENFAKVVGQLEYFDQLAKLNLPGLAISDRSLSELKRLPNLRVLVLARTRITNDGLKHLNALKKLAALSLESTDISDEGLKSLIGLDELHFLNLDHTKVTDRGMTHLTRLPKLSELSISDTEVTDEGLLRLENAIGAISVSDD